MAEVPQDLEGRLIEQWCMGDEDAMALLHALFLASQHADDIVDEGGGLPALHHLSALLMIYFGQILPNPFAQQHALVLGGSIIPGIANWTGATAWENDPASDDERLAFAYVLREALDAVVVMVAFIVGGPAHAQRVQLEAAEIYNFGIAREGLDAWKAERKARLRSVAKGQSDGH